MTGITPMRELVQFVTITTDPQNDTPDVMREYGKTHGLAPANWVFLTSGPMRLSTTRELVEKFGHKSIRSMAGFKCTASSRM